MEKQINIRDLFGLTQPEMAMLLKISRARYSMFESGKRSLPLEAELRLANMLKQAKTIAAENHKKLPHAGPQLDKARKMLEASIMENEYRRHTVARSIAALERRYDAHSKALQLIGLLTSEAEFKTGKEPELLGIIESTAKKGVEDNSLPKLVKQRVRLSTLQHEASALKEELQKLA
jgi:transcriptional regulator with XRE-family HTH domain